MKRLNKIVEIRINPRFSWTDWELYDMPASSMAAAELNGLLADLVNTGSTRHDVENKMIEAMEARAEFGCTDREPRVFLEQILTEVFGD